MLGGIQRGRRSREEMIHRCCRVGERDFFGRTERQRDGGGG